MTIQTVYSRDDIVPVIIDGSVWQCKIRDVYVTYLRTMAEPIITYAGDAWYDVFDPKGRTKRMERAWSGSEVLIDQAKHIVAGKAFKESTDA
jgi:hypothetical protein